MSKSLSLSLSLACIALLSSTTAHAGEGIQITWLGHAAFEIVSPAGTKLLIDPFISGNPSTPADKKDLALYKPDAILVTHRHADHFQAASVAARLAVDSRVRVIAPQEVIDSLVAFAPAPAL